MTRIVTVVGARPQFVKAAVLSRLLERTDGVEEVLVHTGQHYDDAMSDVFFRELDLRRPDHSLGIGSGSHGEQTGRMLAAVERVLLETEPDAVVVYGDTNSTLAGALAAAKLHVPVAHVEAGLRSFDRRMPEEVNRCVTDHLATWHLCPTDVAVANLAAEGITHNVHQVGDVMCDAVRYYAAQPGECPVPVGDDERFALCTIHRAANTDDESRMRSIWSALGELAREITIVLPLHPRTRHVLDRFGLVAPPGLRLVEPVSYRTMLELERRSALIVTDSGGVQKEAYMHGKPCVTLRDETEWTETVDAGWNELVGANEPTILTAARRFLSAGPPTARPSLYGEGDAGERIVAIVCDRANTVGRHAA